MAARLTAEMKLAIVNRFVDLTQKSALSSHLAAQQVGQPLSSIYRWIKDYKALNAQAKVAVADGMTITRAIEILVRPDDGAYARHEALFKMFAWMRWPRFQGDHPTVITSCVTSYLAQTSGKHNAAQLEGRMQAFLLRSLRLRELAWMCTADFENRPEFEYVDGRDRGTVYYALGNVIWFLLRFEPKVWNARNVASLRKAAFLLENDAFGMGAWATNDFRDWWKALGPSIPFWFVMREASALDWGKLQPRSQTFAEDVDRMLRQESALVDFFARCKWVVQRLQARLDRRAWEGLAQPRFPDDLQPVEFPLRPLPVAIFSALNSY